MIRRVTRTEQPERDLLETWVYLAENGYLDAADRLLYGIDEECKALAGMPGLGRPREYPTPGLRSFVTGKYVLYYRQTSDGIILLRVLHGARDIDPLFPGQQTDTD